MNVKKIILTGCMALLLSNKIVPINIVASNHNQQISIFYVIS
jgi:hypothetical protein